MPKWLQYILAGVLGFGSGAATVTANADSKTPVPTALVLSVGAVTAVNALTGLATKKPQ